MSHNIKRLNHVVPMIATLLGITVSTTAVVAQTTQRPIEDFVSKQGTYCSDDEQGGCGLFVPPVQNFLGFIDDPDDNRVQRSGLGQLCASVDYAGLANKWLKEQNQQRNLGTEITGTITEHELPNGRAEVYVRLYTKNALAWVVEGSTSTTCDFANDPLIFGYRAPEVLAGASPTLADSFLSIRFINTAPNAPLPDLLQLLYAPNEGQKFVSVLLDVTATGSLRPYYGVPDGTPGKLQIMQRGLSPKAIKDSRPTPPGIVKYDGFPVETINLTPIQGGGK